MTADPLSTAAAASTVPAPAPAPTARAIARDVRITAMKARRVVDLVRGRRATEADAVLAFAPQAAAEPVRKLLASAVANAGQKFSASADELVITRAYVDEGPTWKRMRPRSRSQAFRILKRTSHITIEVSLIASAEAGRSNRSGKKSGKGNR